MNTRKIKNLERLSKSKSEPKDLAFLDEVELTNDLLEEQNKLIKENTEALKASLAKGEDKPEMKIKINTDDLKGEPGEPGEDGEPGKDYVLTEQDKLEIASLAILEIEVPVVEKVIEKTETIREIPIVTEKLIEITKENPVTAVQVRDLLETFVGKERLDKNAIQGLEKVIDQDILDRAISILDQRTSYLINRVTNLANSINSSSSSGGGGGGFTYNNETPSGTPSGDGEGGGLLTFTLAHTPVTPTGLMLYGSGGTGSTWLYIQGVDYTISGATITFTVAPLTGTILRGFYA